MFNPGFLIIDMMPWNGMQVKEEGIEKPQLIAMAISLQRNIFQIPSLGVYPSTHCHLPIVPLSSLHLDPVGAIICPTSLASVPS